MALYCTLKGSGISSNIRGSWRGVVTTGGERDMTMGGEGGAAVGGGGAIMDGRGATASGGVVTMGGGVGGEGGCYEMSENK